MAGDCRKLPTEKHHSQIPFLSYSCCPSLQTHMSIPACICWLRGKEPFRKKSCLGRIRELVSQKRQLVFYRIHFCKAGIPNIFLSLVNWRFSSSWWVRETHPVSSLALSLQVSWMWLYVRDLSIWLAPFYWLSWHFCLCSWRKSPLNLELNFKHVKLRDNDNEMIYVRTDALVGGKFRRESYF